MRKEQLVSDKRGVFQREIDEWVKTEGILEEGESIQVQFVLRKIVTTVIPPTETLSEPIGSEMAAKLAMKISDLDLSVRAHNCLTHASPSIETVGDLVRRTSGELLTLRSFSLSCLRQVKRKLEEMGLSLKG